MVTYGRTDIGQNRQINQDYIFYSDKPVGNLPNLYIAADGMGGHKAGEHASRYSVECFVDCVKNSQKTGAVLVMNEAIQKVNCELLREADSCEEYGGMGTTFVAASVDMGILYVMNIGDSRLYVIGEDIRQITMDHSLVGEMVRNGELTTDEMRNHPQKNVITRAVGASEHVVPDFFEVDLYPGDRILLCSDGLTNMIEDDEIFDVVHASETPEQTVNRLIGRANFYGGKDNIASIIAEYECAR